MIAIKYLKTDGAEYLSHLDLLRHVYRTLRRAGISVAQSQGYHAHARIFLNNPLPVGVRSVAEYGAIDAEFDGDFLNTFNEFSPKGIKCAGYKIVGENPNYAAAICRCEYVARGISPFEPSEILGEKEITITDLRGRTVDIRPRIYALEYEKDTTRFTLGCGTENLRPDLFAAFLCKRFGGACRDILKIAAYGEGVF